VVDNLGADFSERGVVLRDKQWASRWLFGFIRQSLLPVLLCAGLGAVQSVIAQAPIRPLKQRLIPCQVQYAQSVQTIGLARWSAPESERPGIERLLNAAAEAKELVDEDFLQWVDTLCSTDTLSQLRGSVDRLEANKWLPSSPEEKRTAQAAAANAELLKAIQAGL
jgi:hypothetical protein